MYAHKAIISLLVAHMMHYVFYICTYVCMHVVSEICRVCLSLNVVILNPSTVRTAMWQFGLISNCGSNPIIS